MMNLTYLRYFCDAAADASLAKAARRNHVTRSAISQAIRKLEDALETELLVHHKNRFKLTDAGTLVAARCKDVFRSIEDLQNEVRTTKRDFAGSVQIAASHSIAHTLLPQMLRRFHARYPRIQPRLKLGGTGPIKRWIETGEVEIGLTVDDGLLDPLERAIVSSGHFSVVQSKSAQGSVEGLGFLVTADRPEVQELKRFHLKKHRSELKVAMEVDSWEVIAALAVEGLGVGLVPDFLLSTPVGRRLEQLSYGPLPPYELCAVFQKRTFLSFNARLFLEEIMESAQP